MAVAGRKAVPRVAPPDPCPLTSAIPSTCANVSRTHSTIGVTLVPNIPLRNGGPKARIAVIPGDGIGKEVTLEGVKAIRAATSGRNRPIEFIEFDWGADKFI